MKLSKKDVVQLKDRLTKEILVQMNADEDDGGYATIVGYETSNYMGPYQVLESLVVHNETTHIPRHWHAGIFNSSCLKFGDGDDVTADLSRQDFAEEESLRKLRDIFSDQADFITWAWHN